MQLIINIFAILATVFLLLAAWGLVHQAILNAKAQSTEAISPARYIGTLISQAVWVLIALCTPQPNFPLLIGCGAMVLGCTAVLVQIYQYTPKRSIGLLSLVGIVSVLCYVALFYFGFQRELLFPYASVLGITGVIVSFVLLHLGTLDQFRLNRQRKSVKDLSLQKEILHFLDWGVWLIYPALLGLSEHWAPFANAAVGFVATLMVLYQFKIYAKR